ncbi:mucin-17-like [Argopecten irradians]|uniref:mucin-17-like n=1 Tax=Argopecten irradians TaxID=31199 RepID=UPI003716A696
MSKVADSGALPPTEDLSSSPNNTPSVPGHYINTSTLLTQNQDTENDGDTDPETRESSLLSNGADHLSDVEELESDVEDVENNRQLFDSSNKRQIENGGVSERTLAFEDPAVLQYNNTTTMEQEEAIEKPRPTRKYLQRKRLKLLVNKVMENFKANVRNQRPLRLHMNVKPKQAWEYGPLTTGAYNDLGDLFCTMPLTEWTIEGQISAEESEKSVVYTQDTARAISASDREERRFTSPSTDNYTVLADAYMVDTDEEKTRDEEDIVNVQGNKSRATSAAVNDQNIKSRATSAVPNSLDPVDNDNPNVTGPGFTSTPRAAPSLENVTSVALTPTAENPSLHVATIPTENRVSRTTSPIKGLVKSSTTGATPSDKPQQRSAPINKVNSPITFISATYEKPKPNVTFARSTTSIPTNVTNAIHSAPPSTALHKEDTWGSRAPLPSLASHDSMKLEEEGSETSSSSPQNKRKIIVTLPDISTDVEDRKKVLHTQITPSESRNGFPSAKTSKSLPKQRQKSPPNYTLEGSARTLTRKQTDLPNLKVTNLNEETLTSSLFRIAPANTQKGSIEIVTSENVSAGSDSVSSPEVVDTIPPVTPMVASIPKLHAENPLLSVKGTNVSSSTPLGECTADSSSSESVDMSRNMLGNRLSIVIVNRKRAKACRQRHKRKSAHHQSEPEMRLFRSSYTRRNKDMEYTGPFIERSKTLEFPSLSPGKVWNPDLEATAIRTNPENHKGK